MALCMIWTSKLSSRCENEVQTDSVTSSSFKEHGHRHAVVGLLGSWAETCDVSQSIVKREESVWYHRCRE